MYFKKGSLFRLLPLESIFVCIVCLIGIVGEYFTGFSPVLHSGSHSHVINECNASTHSNSNHNQSHNSHNSHQKIEYIEYSDNLQHITMYSAFTFGSIVHIMLQHMGKTFDLPQRIDQAFYLICFLIEGLIFAFHLHGWTPLDIHLHVLLVYSIFATVFFCCLEFANPDEILYTFGRCLCVLLQGTWFWQMSFILYAIPLIEDTHIDTFILKRWKKCDHEEIMNATMLFCWHILIIMLAILANYLFMKRLYSNYFLSCKESWNELIQIDDKFTSEVSVVSSFINKTYNNYKKLIENDDDDSKISCLDDENV